MVQGTAVVMKQFGNQHYALCTRDPLLIMSHLDAVTLQLHIPRMLLPATHVDNLKTCCFAEQIRLSLLIWLNGWQHDVHTSSKEPACDTVNGTQC